MQYNWLDGFAITFLTSPDKKKVTWLKKTFENAYFWTKKWDKLKEIAHNIVLPLSLCSAHFCSPNLGNSSPWVTPPWWAGHPCRRQPTAKHFSLSVVALRSFYWVGTQRWERNIAGKARCKSLHPSRDSCGQLFRAENQRFVCKLCWRVHLSQHSRRLLHLSTNWESRTTSLAARYPLVKVKTWWGTGCAAHLVLNKYIVFLSNHTGTTRN